MRWRPSRISLLPIWYDWLFRYFRFCFLCFGSWACESRWRIPGRSGHGGELYSYCNILGFGKSHVPVSDQDVFDCGCFRNSSLRGIGLLSMFLGGEFLDYAELEKVLPVSREMARYHAMLGVEIGVGFTVTAIMFALYANLASEGRLKEGL